MSCSTNTPNINKTFIIESIQAVVTGCTTYSNLITDCSGGTITFDSNLEIVDNIFPLTDLTSDIGTPLKRFREVNAYSGNTSIWIATQTVITPSLDLGLDSMSNTRIINANNSIIQDDTLLGGTY